MLLSLFLHIAGNAMCQATAASHFGRVCAASITRPLRGQAFLPAIPNAASPGGCATGRIAIGRIHPRGPTDRQMLLIHQRFLNANCRY
jgi:hypothetical protein